MVAKAADEITHTFVDVLAGPANESRCIVAREEAGPAKERGLFHCRWESGACGKFVCFFVFE